MFNKERLLETLKSFQENEDVKQMLDCISRKGGLFIRHSHPVYSFHCGDKKLSGMVRAVSTVPGSLALLGLSDSDEERTLQIVPQCGHSMQNGVLFTQGKGGQIAVPMAFGFTVEEMKFLLWQLDIVATG